MSYWSEIEGYTTPYDDAKKCLGIFKRNVSKEGIGTILKKKKSTPAVNYGHPKPSTNHENSAKRAVPIKRKRESEISPSLMPPRKIQALPLGNTKSRMTDFATELRWAVDHMMRHKDGHPFLVPVTEAIAPGYFALVDEPMDLSTIKQKVPTYSTIKEFDEDVQLMFQNSFTYNTGGFMVTITQR